MTKIDTNKSKPLIIAVEDDDLVVAVYETAFKPEYIVKRALNLDEVHDLMTDGVIVVAILVSGRHQRSSLDGPTIVRELRKTYQGAIIATSGHPDYEADLSAAGCTFALGKPILPSQLKLVIEEIAAQIKP